MNQDDFDLLESDLFGIQVIKKSSLHHIKKRIGRVIGAYKKVGSKSCFLSNHHCPKNWHDSSFVVYSVTIYRLIC